MNIHINLVYVVMMFIVGVVAIYKLAKADIEGTDLSDTILLGLLMSVFWPITIIVWFIRDI